MKTTSELTEDLRKALEHPDRGVVGLADDLLGLCPDQGLRLDWKSGRCQVRPLADGPHVSLDVLLPKSVFRAILARVAALCNEHRPGSVSAYGGKGELTAGADQSAVFRVTFTNTAEKQQLELLPHQ